MTQKPELRVNSYNLFQGKALRGRGLGGGEGMSLMLETTMKGLKDFGGGKEPATEMKSHGTLE